MSKLVIFDLDDTLYVETDALGENVMWCLEYLKSKGHQMAIASYNDDGVALLHRFGIYEYFAAIECCIPGRLTKMQLITKILGATGKIASDVIFFDDSLHNVTEATRAGIQSVHVNWKTGVTCLDIHTAGL
jgi:FMN phosphatase YigB (HAD superfamily)